MMEKILAVFLLIWCVLQCEARYWLKQPGTVYACPGDDVTFPWQYDPQINDVVMVYWKFLTNGQTVAGHHLKPFEKTVFYHSTYENRVTLLEQDVANAGFTLKSVTSDDSGNYGVELLQSGLSDTATLKIIQESDLQTLIFVDDEEVGPDTFINKHGRQSVDVKVRSKSVVNGTIVLAMTGQRSIACMMRSSCSATFDLQPDNEDISGSMRAFTVSVYYGACQPQEKIIRINTAMKESTTTSDVGVPFIPEENTGLHPGSIAAISLAVILFVFIVTTLALWAIFYRKQSTGYALEPWQRKYYNFKVFQPLRACKKDSSRIEESRRVPISLGPKPGMQESTRSLNKPLNRTLTVEDITVVHDAKNNIPDDSLDGKHDATEEMIRKDSEADDFDDIGTDSDFDTRHDQSVPDHDTSDARITSLQYSEIDDANNSMSRFV